MQDQIAKIGDNLPPANTPENLQIDLADRHEKVLTGARNLIGAAARIPEVIDDEETAGKAGDYIKQVTGCVKNLEALRVSEKEPYLSLGRVVDGFFKRTQDSLNTSKMAAEKPLGVYLKKKAAAEQKRRDDEAAALRAKQAEEEKAAKMLQDAAMVPQAEQMLDQAIITEQAVAKAEVQAAAKPADMAKSRGDAGSLASLRTVWVGELEDQDKLDLERLRHHLHPDALRKAINSYVSGGGRELRGAKIYESSKPVVR
jgi:hypothetical protein